MVKHTAPLVTDSRTVVSLRIHPDSNTCVDRSHVFLTTEDESVISLEKQ